MTAGGGFSSLAETAGMRSGVPRRHQVDLQEAQRQTDPAPGLPDMLMRIPDFPVFGDDAPPRGSARPCRHPDFFLPGAVEEVLEAAFPVADGNDAGSGAGRLKLLRPIQPLQPAGAVFFIVPPEVGVQREHPHRTTGGVDRCPDMGGNSLRALAAALQIAVSDLQSEPSGVSSEG